jgi:hypothetical protein
VELQGSICVALLLFSLLLSPSLFPPHPLQILRMDSCPPVAILVGSGHMWGRSCSSMLMAWCSKPWSQHLAPPCRGECMYSRPQGTPVLGATQPSLPLSCRQSSTDVGLYHHHILCRYVLFLVIILCLHSLLPPPCSKIRHARPWI